MLRKQMKIKKQEKRIGLAINCENRVVSSLECDKFEKKKHLNGSSFKHQAKLFLLRKILPIV